MARRLASDKVLFTAVIVLVGLGLTMVYSASATVGRDGPGGLNLFIVKQSGAAVVGLLAMWGVMHLDYRRLRHPAVIYGLLGGVVALLVAVLYAPELNNTRRWLFLGGISVQPAELAKLALVPFLAYQIEKKDPREEQRELLLPCAVISGAVCVLVLAQPDLGTSVLLCAAALLMLFLAGVRWSFFAGGAAALAPVLWYLILSVNYRRQRLFAFLQPDSDLQGVNYQAHQSLIAVGSGGLLGLGLGNSVQKLYYLPHPHSDFVFSIVAEELGLVGALGLIALFCVVAWRGIRAGRRAPDLFGRYLAWGFTGILTLQALVHIGVALALLPTKGIPLPFISYGGSSLVVCLTAAGVVLNVSQHG